MFSSNHCPISMKYILILSFVLLSFTNVFSQILLRPYFKKSLSSVFAEAIANPEISIYHVEHEIFSEEFKWRFETQVRAYVKGDLVEVVPLDFKNSSYHNTNEDDYFTPTPNSQWIVAVVRNKETELYQLSNRGYSTVLCLFLPREKDFVKIWSYGIVNDLKVLTDFYVSLNNSGETILLPKSLELETAFGNEVLDKLLAMIN